MPRARFEHRHIRTIFWRRFLEWFLELLALGLLPWLAHLIIAEDSENVWQLPELYLFVMVIGVTCVFDTLKDQKTMNFMKPVAAVTGMVSAVLAPQAFVRLSLAASPPLSAMMKNVAHFTVMWILVALSVYAVYRIPLMVGQARAEARVIDTKSVANEVTP